jgi:hypothetical protein
MTNQGLFEPKVMSFGLTNSPVTFQSLMNSIFADLIAEGKVAVYLDDILIWSDNLTQHRKIVHEVLKHLEEHDLYLRPEKCEFEKEEITIPEVRRKNCSSAHKRILLLRDVTVLSPKDILTSVVSV